MSKYLILIITCMPLLADVSDIETSTTGSGPMVVSTEPSAGSTASFTSPQSYQAVVARIDWVTSNFAKPVGQGAPQTNEQANQVTDIITKQPIASYAQRNLYSLVTGEGSSQEAAQAIANEIVGSATQGDQGTLVDAAPIQKSVSEFLESIKGVANESSPNELASKMTKIKANWEAASKTMPVTTLSNPPPSLQVLLFFMNVLYR